MVAGPRPWFGNSRGGAASWVVTGAADRARYSSSWGRWAILWVADSEDRLVRYLILPALGLLAACASQPPTTPTASLGPDLAEARRLLLGSGGAIPLEVDRPPTVLGSDPRTVVARAASDATQWAAANFTPAAAPASAGTRLVMQFDESAPAGSGACASQASGAPLADGAQPGARRAVRRHAAVAEAVGRSQGVDAPVGATRWSPRRRRGCSRGSAASRPRPMAGRRAHRASASAASSAAAATAAPAGRHRPRLLRRAAGAGAEPLPLPSAAAAGTLRARLGPAKAGG